MHPSWHPALRPNSLADYLEASKSVQQDVTNEDQAATFASLAANISSRSIEHESEPSLAPPANEQLLNHEEKSLQQQYITESREEQAGEADHSADLPAQEEEVVLSGLSSINNAASASIHEPAGDDTDTHLSLGPPKPSLSFPPVKEEVTESMLTTQNASQAEMIVQHVENEAALDTMAWPESHDNPFERIADQEAADATKTALPDPLEEYTNPLATENGSSFTEGLSLIPREDPREDPIGEGDSQRLDLKDDEWLASGKHTRDFEIKQSQKPKLERKTTAQVLQSLGGLKHDVSATTGQENELSQLPEPSGGPASDLDWSIDTAKHAVEEHDDFFNGPATGKPLDGSESHVDLAQASEIVPALDSLDRSKFTQPADQHWSADGGAEDDFFGGQETAPSSTAVRTGTQSVSLANEEITSVANESASEKPFFADDEPDFLLDSSVRDIAGSVSAETKLDSTAELENEETGPHQEPDLAATWGDIFDDEEFLAEEPSNDMSFLDDDDGFLQDDVPATSLQQTVPKPNVYAPQTTAVPGPTQNALYQNFTESLNASNNIYSTHQAPMPPMLANRAESFVDKAKRGYSSPYDLPTELAPRIRSRPTAPASTNSMKTSAPPLGANQQDSRPASSSNNLPQSPATKSNAPSAFFEELPSVPRPRSVRPPTSVPSSIQSNPPPPPRSESTFYAPPSNAVPLSTTPRPSASFVPNVPAGVSSVSTNQYVTSESGSSVPSSRYSPAPQNYAAQLQQNKTAPPFATPPPRPSSTSAAQAFLPRTSSPLAQSTVSKPQTNPLPALIETPREQSFEPIASRPPPRAASTAYALPTQRSTPNREASSQATRSMPAVPKPATGLGPSASRPLIPERVFIPPNNGMEQDSFQRWLGASILRFGFDGKALSMRPREEPRYAAGSMQPSYLRLCGDVKILSSSAVLSGSDLASFPGPLKSKSKKKDLLTWMKGHLSFLQAGLQNGTFDSADASNDAGLRAQERLMLWRLISHFVEHDGVLQGTPASDVSLSAIFDANGAGESSAHQNAIVARPVQAKSDTERDIVGTMNAMMTALLNGEREKAMWAAVDQKMWGHALLLAGTLSKDIWKQVCHEFVQTEVKSAGENTEIFAAFYNILSGSGAESVDQLVPPSARAGLQLMSVNSTAGSARDPKAGLAKWTDLLRLILKNRTGDDASALTALGQLLLNYGRIEAAHICFICSMNPTMLGSVDNPQASIVLLGANARTQPGSLLDADNILLTEAFEFAMTQLRSSQPHPPLHYLQAFKIQHATALIELGEKAQAQQYCDTIAAAMKGGPKVSTYYHPIVFSALEDLATRITQADKDASNKSWLGRPAMGNVSGTVWNRFTTFVSGEDAASDDKSATASESEFGPFATVNGETPSISRSTSPMMQYGSAGSSYAPQMHKSNSFLATGHSNTTPSSSLPYAPTSTKSMYTASIKSNPLPSRSSSQYAPVRKPYAPYQPLPSEGVTVTPPDSATLDTRPRTPLTDGSSPVNNRSAFSSPQRTAQSQPPASAHYQPYHPTPSDVNGSIAGNTPSLSYPGQTYDSQEAQSKAAQTFDDGYQPLVSSNGEVVPELPSAMSPHDQGYVPAERPPDSAEIIASSDGTASNPENGADLYDISKAASPSYMNGGSLAPPPFQPFEPASPATAEEEVANLPEERASTAVQESTTYPSYGSYAPYGRNDSSAWTAGDDAPPNAEESSYSGYEPPSYSYSSGYDPGIPDQPAPEFETQDSDEDKNASKKKKKSFMDLSDDEDSSANPITSARLRPTAISGFTPTTPSFPSTIDSDDRAARDRAAQEAFMRAAEADAARDSANKAAKTASGSGITSYLSFGGLWGSKKASPDPSKDGSSGKGDAPVKAIKAKLGEENSFYFDPQLKKWVNKKAGAENARPSAPTPPPPRSAPPSRAVSAAATPSQSMPGLGIGPSSTPGPDNDLPPVPSVPPSFASATPPPGSGPPTRPGTGLGMGTPPPGGAMPPKKKNDLDDLLAGASSGRGTVKKSKKGGSRYLDVMAK